MPESSTPAASLQRRFGDAFAALALNDRVFYVDPLTRVEVGEVARVDVNPLSRAVALHVRTHSGRRRNSGPDLHVADVDRELPLFRIVETQQRRDVPIDDAVEACVRAVAGTVAATTETGDRDFAPDGPEPGSTIGAPLRAAIREYIAFHRFAVSKRPPTNVPAVVESLNQGAAGVDQFQPTRAND